MVYGLLTIGTYFCSAIIIHLTYLTLRRVDPNDMESKHYVLYTLNNQHHIEWIIRSLVVFYWLQGKSISITIIDEGSSDDTLPILNLLSRHHRLDVHMNDEEGLESLPLRDTSIHIRLNTPEDLQKLPQLSSI